MAVFSSDKPAKTVEEEGDKVNHDDPSVETSINPLDSSSFSSSSSSSTDWYLGSDSVSWSGSYDSDNEFGKFDDEGMEMVNVISDESRSTSDEELPVNVASIPVGVVLSVKGKKVIVEGKENHNVLKGSFLWITETRLPLGYVDKIFGTIKKPCFRVRLQVPQGTSQGTQVSLIVEDYVQHDKKGCDASSSGDEIDEIQFSDDEKEAECRKMHKKMAKRGMSSEQKTGETGNKKKVLGLGSSEQTLVSPNRSDSQMSPVRSQAIAGTGDLVPQHQPLPRMGRFAAPRRSETNQQKPYQHPMANQTGIISNPVSTQAPTWMRPMPNPIMYPAQPRFRNGQNSINQQPFGDRHQPYPNAAPWPKANSNRFPHPHPQTQPMQSQRLNVRPSSNRGKGLVHYRGVGKGRGFGRGRGRVQDQPR